MIRIADLWMKYKTDQGVVEAVRGISLEVSKGDFCTLLGASGCGKTSTLRCVAGLEQPLEGEIIIGDRLMVDAARKIFVPPNQRGVGMVFQSYAIWPHMTVFDNIAFPLREGSNKLTEAEVRTRVHRALQIVQLDAALQRRPAPFLSGGQQQRLALARALAQEPQVLLLDEPLSNLDAKLREETRLEIRRIVKELSITTLYVTHDQAEALSMSDKVAVMHQGEILQVGNPRQIYEMPVSEIVASFVGASNLIPATVMDSDTTGELRRAGTAMGVLRCRLPNGVVAGNRVILLIRPEDLQMCEMLTAGRLDENVVQGQVEECAFLGEAQDCRIKVGESSMRARVHRSVPITKGETVNVRLPPDLISAIKP